MELKGRKRMPFVANKIWEVKEAYSIINMSEDSVLWAGNAYLVLRNSTMERINATANYGLGCGELLLIVIARYFLNIEVTSLLVF